MNIRSALIALAAGLLTASPNALAEERSLQLAMKTGPRQCVPVLCWVDKVGWCMCDPCSLVNDCRAATGKKPASEAVTNQSRKNGSSPKAK